MVSMYIRIPRFIGACLLALSMPGTALAQTPGNGAPALPAGTP